MNESTLQPEIAYHWRDTINRIGRKAYRPDRAQRWLLELLYQKWP